MNEQTNNGAQKTMGLNNKKHTGCNEERDTTNEQLMTQQTTGHNEQTNNGAQEQRMGHKKLTRHNKRMVNISQQTKQ